MSNVIRKMSKPFKINDNSIHTNNDIEMNEYRPPGLKPTEYSVYLRNATKCYGFNYNEVIVFNNLDVTVPKGEIYALLGASGCGKTTLLSCILGSKKLNYGKIWVLGGTPGTKNSRVPGPSVGYMPQETALYASFTIDETLLYFGWVAGMPTNKIRQQCRFLKELLMLNHTNETIRNLSGGEQRRVSLAVALIHEPELLVLDEPTVGIDPIIRQTVWSYMTKLSQERNTTIIITTHYIEEARQAHKVALMREGMFLAEESPETLMNRFGDTSLQETFLKLSSIQNRNFLSQFQQAGSQNVNYFIDKSTLPLIPFERHRRTTLEDFIPILNISRIKALLFKGFLWMVRNLAPMAFIILLPLVIVSIFYYTIGRSPVDLSVAITNLETQNTFNCDSFLTCNSTQLSCCYTKYLEFKGVKFVYYPTEEEAIQSVVQGKTYASMVIRRNYTKALHARLNDGELTDPWDLKYSEIDVFRDVNNKQIATYLKIYLYKTFQEFLEDYMEVCGKHRKALKIPINFEEPVYGSMEPNFTDAVVPAVVLLIIFNLAVGTTSISMLMERNEGTLERTYVIGIIDTELMLTHFICEFCITFTQIVLTIFGTFFLFSMTMKGSLTLVFLICCFSGICGMSYGLFISCVCDKELTATMVATGSLVSVFLVCGVIWPLESVHWLFKPFVCILPFTTGTESLRSILQRGWDITVSSVYLGFISFGVWSIILMILSMVLLKLKK